MVLAAVTTSLVSLLGPSVGVAADPLPVGQADGVRVERQQDAIVIVFTKRAAPLYRRIAGKRIVVDCVRMPKTIDGVRQTSGGETAMWAPRRRRPLRPGEGSRNLDYCSVSLAARKVVRGDTTTHYARKPIVAVAITQAGAVHLDESAKASMLQALHMYAGARRRSGETGYLTAPELLQQTGGYLWRSPYWRNRPRIVALASPDDTPPPGALGFYSDGDRHVAAVIVSASGRRLFLELAPDEVLHTNVAEYGVADFLFTGST
jgi:hypothetical protein